MKYFPKRKCVMPSHYIVSNHGRGRGLVISTLPLIHLMSYSYNPHLWCYLTPHLLCPILIPIPISSIPFPYHNHNHNMYLCSYWSNLSSSRHNNISFWYNKKGISFPVVLTDYVHVVLNLHGHCDPLFNESETKHD